MSAIRGRTTRRKAGAIGGGAWTAIERVVSQGCQLAVFITAARVLSPAEFGLFALISACVILLMRAAEGGWAAYIMSWSGDPQVPRQVLWIALLSGIGAGAVGALAGISLPAFGAPWEAAELVLLFSLWLVLAVTSSAAKGVLIWQGKLKTAAGLEIGAELCGLAAALAGLAAGYGIFALVAGRLAYQSVHLAGCLLLSRSVPRPGLRGEPLRDLLAVSGQLFAVRMIYNMRVYAATFVIGAFLGPAAVGFYRAAERLVGALAEVVGVPAQTLGWGLFRAARDRADGTTEGFQNEAAIFFPALLALTVPAFLWVAIMAEDIVLGVLGPDWLPALPVIALLAAARAVMMPGAVTEPILTVAGEIGRLPRLSIFYLLMTVGLVLVSAPFGLLPLAWSQVAVGVVIAVTTMRLLRRYAGIHWLGFAPRLLQLLPPIAVGGLTVWALRESALFADWSPLLRAFGVIPPALLVYALALMAAVPDLRRPVLMRIRRRQSQAAHASRQ